MKTRDIFLLIIFVNMLFWACVPRQPLPPLLEPTPPPEIEAIDYEGVFLEAETLFAKQLLEDALEKYRFYLQSLSQGENADTALKRIGDIHNQRDALESARKAYQ